MNIIMSSRTPGTKSYQIQKKLLKNRTTILNPRSQTQTDPDPDGSLLSGAAGGLWVKFIGGDVYSAVKEKYTSLFESNVSVGEVLDAMTRKLNISGGENLASSDTSSDTTAVNAVVSADAASSDSASAASDSAKDENNFLPINSVPVESTTSSEEEAKAVGLSLDASASNGGINEMTVPVTGTITSGFGYRTHPIYGTYLFHSGVDIGTESGTPISAALSGTVETAEYSSSYGYYIILSHSDSVKTVYAHCSELLKIVGDTVSKGETIALVGSTEYLPVPICILRFELAEFA